jgi:hypothetical protein
MSHIDSCQCDAAEDYSLVRCEAVSLVGEGGVASGSSKNCVPFINKVMQSYVEIQIYVTRQRELRLLMNSFLHITVQ